VAQEGDTAVLTVHDNGPGIDPGVREELFARFARGDSSRARQTGGTGLGLAIVKAIVEGHSGYISVASEPGSTSFTVRIPVNPSKDAPS
ncbi:MAG: HAMP domain-containing sensor histidine kinase, partial [Microbacterium sp.]|uniref:sensor histidine kinase n=1 Tax=Microbacterium sp. TaxID=51671 RepID=UPI003BAF854E